MTYWRGWGGLGVPRESGIYFLMNEDWIMYVGRSQNLFRRIRTHQFKREIIAGRFKVSVHLMDLKDAIELERQWIALLDPPLNDEFVSKQARRRLRASNGSHAKR